MKSRSWKTSRAIVCSSSSLSHATDGISADEVEVASPVGGGDEFLACCLVHFEDDKQIRTFQKFQSAPSLTAVELRVRRAAHELGLPALALLRHAVLRRAMRRARDNDLLFFCPPFKKLFSCFFFSKILSMYMIFYRARTINYCTNVFFFFSRAHTCIVLDECWSLLDVTMTSPPQRSGTGSEADEGHWFNLRNQFTR